MGVIEPSSSEWSSLIILVPKKDSTLRFCLDFRKVKGKVGRFPSPRRAERSLPSEPSLDTFSSLSSPSASQMKSFLCLVGWYGCFIWNFSTLAVPLNNLSRKNQPNKVQWTAECEEAFQSLTGSLCTEPVLKSPDFDQPFNVQTDASHVGIGAALLQGEPGNLQPIAHISRKLLKHEVRYSVVEKECLAIKWVLDSLKYYLQGRKFTLETDHHALIWLSNMKDTNSRITRWFLAMQPFDFVVQYRKGHENCAADFLSNAPQGWPLEGGRYVTGQPRALKEGTYMTRTAALSSRRLVRYFIRQFILIGRYLFASIDVYKHIHLIYFTVTKNRSN